MQRLWTVSVLIVTVGMLATVVYVIGQHDVIPQAGQTPGYTATPTFISPPNTAGTASPAATKPLIRTVFLGDDYTLGTGASSPHKSWTTLVSAALGLHATVLGANRAGYARKSHTGQTYASFTARAVAAKPDLIIVSGGRNDVTDNPATLRDSAKALFAALHANAPHAALIALAPLWGDSNHPPKLAPVTTAVKAAVTAAKGHYLNLPDPLHRHKNWMASLADPNDNGYAAITSALTPVLRPHLPK